ncbi:unnamed protein product [Trichobilharzia regenti]|nr:unnamed protein product [Trichobilharzia regenti]
MRTDKECSTDLAEIPSTLFEHFALDSRVTLEYARHWRTGRRPDPTEMKILEQLFIARGLGQSVEVSQQVGISSLSDKKKKQEKCNIKFSSLLLLLYNFN